MIDVVSITDLIKPELPVGPPLHTNSQKHKVKFDPLLLHCKGGEQLSYLTAVVGCPDFVSMQILNGSVIKPDIHLTRLNKERIKCLAVLMSKLILTQGQLVPPQNMQFSKNYSESTIMVILCNVPSELLMYGTL